MFSEYNNSSILIFPPKKIIKSYYRCDNRFHLDNILDMYNESFTNYGIVLVSGKEYRCYILSICNSCKEFKLIKSDIENLQKKQKKGGQSAPRISRIRTEKYNRYISKIADVIVETYMKNNHTTCIVEGLILAGPSLEKNDVFNNELIQQYFANKILCVTETAEINDGTIYYIYNKCSDYIASDIDKYEIKICKEVNDLISVASDLLYFGDEVIKGIDEYKIKKVIHFSDLKDGFKENILNNKKYNFEVIEIKNINNRHKLPCDLIGISYF